nr:hypothetical protein [Morchella crassipes]
MKPAVASFFRTRSMGASSLISRGFRSCLRSWPCVWLIVGCWALPILVPKNKALSLSALVIRVFVSLRFRLSSFERNSRISPRIATQSLFEPLIPISQSSAYLTYFSRLKLLSMESLDGVLIGSVPLRRGGMQGGALCAPPRLGHFRRSSSVLALVFLLR